MTQTRKAQFWQHHLRAWQGSALSQAAYCRTHHLSLANFGYWRKRLASDTCSVPGIIPVLREAPAAGTQLRSPGGWIISCPALSVELLRTLVAVLP